MAFPAMKLALFVAATIVVVAGRPQDGDGQGPPPGQGPPGGMGNGEELMELMQKIVCSGSPNAKVLLERVLTKMAEADGKNTKVTITDKQFEDLKEKLCKDEDILEEDLGSSSSSSSSEEEGDGSEGMGGRPAGMGGGPAGMGGGPAGMGGGPGGMGDLSEEELKQMQGLMTQIACSDEAREFYLSNLPKNDQVPIETIKESLENMKKVLMAQGKCPGQGNEGQGGAEGAGGP